MPIWDDKPISSIFLENDQVDEKGMLYRGVGVSVVPYILADIGIKYTCFYMDPLDELVLSALGRVLLATYFPHLVDENLVQAFFSDLESHEEVSELLVFSFDRTLLEDVKASQLMELFSTQLASFPGLTDQIRSLLLTYLGLPYVIY